MNQDQFEEIVMSSLEKLNENVNRINEKLSREITNVNEKLSGEITNVNEKLSGEIASIRSDVSWIKGTLEGRSETRHVVLTSISIMVAICAVLVAIFK